MARRIKHLLRLRSRRLLFYSLDLERFELPDLPGQPGFAFKLASVEDIQAHLRDYIDEVFTCEQMRWQLAKGDRLYLQLANGAEARLAWLGWARGGEFLHLALAQRIEFPVGCVDVHDIYTVREFRNRGLAKIGYRGILRDLRAQGARRVFIQVDSGNQPSIRSIEAAGFTPYLKVHFLSILWLRIFRCRPYDGSFAVKTRFKLSKSPDDRLRRVLFPCPPE